MTQSDPEVNTTLVACAPSALCTVAVPCKPVLLDMSKPMLSLRDASGLTLAEFSRAREVKHSSQLETERSGQGVRLSTLIDAANSIGCDVEITVRPKKVP